MARAGRVVPVLVVGLVGVSAPLAAASPAPGTARHASAAGEDATGAAATTVAYVEQFYPLWFTYAQTRFVPANGLIGPNRISPLYQGVVAINNDTLYASAFIDLSGGPVIVSVPQTAAGYSILTLDPFGGIFSTSLPSKPSGTLLPQTAYALVPPGYTGSVPAGVTPVAMPLVRQFLIFRIDRYAPDGTNQVPEGTQFREDLKLQPLSDYVNDPSGGATRILPELAFSLPFKTVADNLIRLRPIVFLRQLQTAVHSANTPPLTPEQQALSDRFDGLFGTGRFGGDAALRTSFRIGARTAHRRILDAYLDHRGENNWIHFTNIGNWGRNALQRAAITEFIQYGNGISTAAYYHTFRDGRDIPLRGSGERTYVLRFPRGAQPPAGRFWSLTAYTPNSIELIPNRARKYLVASYTPHLRTALDGSVSIYISRKRPANVPPANWLPVQSRRFNVMLRVYGVKAGSSVADNTYVPPPVVRVRR